MDLPYYDDGKIVKRMILQIKMPCHWPVQSTMVNVQLMASQTYVERILSLSDVLYGASGTFDQVDYVTGPTICSGFNPELLACGCTAKPAS